MPTSFQLVRLEEILHAEFPLSVHMGLEIVPVGDGFALEAPLRPNRNLQGTFFGGSLSALGLLAGWCWLRLALKEIQLEPDIVVQRSTTDFVAPAPGRARARIEPPDAESWDRFLRTLRRHRRARIAVEILIESPVPGPVVVVGDDDDTDAAEVPLGTGRFRGGDPSALAARREDEPERSVRMVGWFVALERG